MVAFKNFFLFCPARSIALSGLSEEADRWTQLALTIPNLTDNVIRRAARNGANTRSGTHHDKADKAISCASNDVREISEDAGLFPYTYPGDAG